MTSITVPITNIGACHINLPEECPICKSTIVPKLMHIMRSCDMFGDSSEGAVASFGCPSCHELFVVQYGAVSGKPCSFEFQKVGPVYPKKKSFDPVLDDISPMFIEIYNQALAAETYGLNHIAGMGYRKSLEFLIKDYAKILDPEASEEIEKMMLSPCIKKYIDLPKIKATATASVWLGNDETHYIRKFTDKDVNDLKRLINSCVYWILADRDADEASSMISE